MEQLVAAQRQCLLDHRQRAAAAEIRKPLRWRRITDDGDYVQIGAESLKPERGKLDSAVEAELCEPFVRWSLPGDLEAGDPLHPYVGNLVTGGRPNERRRDATPLDRRVRTRDLVGIGLAAYRPRAGA